MVPRFTQLKEHSLGGMLNEYNENLLPETFAPKLSSCEFFAQILGRRRILPYPWSDLETSISTENQDRKNDFEIKLFCNASRAVEELGTKQGNLWELPNKFVNNFCKLVFWQSIISWPEPPSSSERITDSIPSNHHHAWWMFHRRF